MSSYVPRHSQKGTNPSSRKATKIVLPALEDVEPELDYSAADEPKKENTRSRGQGENQIPELAKPLLDPDDGELEQKTDPTLAKIRRRRWPITIGILLVLIVAAGGITYYVLAAQAHEREANRSTAYALLDESIALIQESDTVVVSFDTAATTEVSEVNLSEREVLLERVPTTLETLATAEEKATDALNLLSSSEDREFAQHVIDAAVNRKDMLVSGEHIITKDIEAMNSVLIFGQAWELIVSADSELRATTELSRTGNYHQLREAIERNTILLSNLEQTLALLAQAEEAFPEANFITISNYIVLKKESVQIAIEADQALLDGNAGQVSAKNAEFGLKDAAVVEAAGKIPPEPLTLIIDVYEESTAEARALYDSARANAASADGYIREYVGVETQTGVQ